MEEKEIIQYIAEGFSGVDVVPGAEGIALGDTFFIYDPERTRVRITVVGQRPQSQHTDIRSDQAAAG